MQKLKEKIVMEGARIAVLSFEIDTYAHSKLFNA